MMLLGTSLDQAPWQGVLLHPLALISLAYTCILELNALSLPVQTGITVRSRLLYLSLLQLLDVFLGGSEPVGLVYALSGHFSCVTGIFDPKYMNKYGVKCKNYKAFLVK